MESSRVKRAKRLTQNDVVYGNKWILVYARSGSKVLYVSGFNRILWNSSIFSLFSVLVDMEIDNNNPSEINSFPIIDVVKTIKKRKLLAEQLDLPTAKHKCWESFPCNESVSMSVENADVRSIHTSLIKVKAREHIAENRPEDEAGKDSNSFSVDFDSAISVYGEAKMEPEFVKSYLYDRPSTSINCGTEGVKDAKYTLDNFTVVKNHSGIEELAFLQHDGGTQNHEDQLLEFGNDADYIISEYGDIEQCTDKEFEDVLYSNGLNPNKYVLSSGRWSVNQEVQSSSRKPTIDQEFEQYFSTLML